MTLRRSYEPLGVELQPLERFWPAEEYHQKYLDKNPGGYCHIPRRMMHLSEEQDVQGAQIRGMIQDNTG